SPRFFWLSSPLERPKRTWNPPAGVADLVVPDALLCEVEGPVLLEVAAAAQGAELEHGFGATQRPTRAGDVQPILQQVPARAFDRARRKRKSRGQSAVVVHQLWL